MICDMILACTWATYFVSSMIRLYACTESHGHDCHRTGSISTQAWRFLIVLTSYNLHNHLMWYTVNCALQCSDQYTNTCRFYRFSYKMKRIHQRENEQEKYPQRASPKNYFRWVTFMRKAYYFKIKNNQPLVSAILFGHSVLNLDPPWLFA